MQLLVTLPGQTTPTPLDDCEWVLWDSCGCAAGVMVAGGYPTEESAWREWYPRQRDREKAQREMRMELMSHARCCAEVTPTMKYPCPHRPEETP